jgi:hypothetical protein
MNVDLTANVSANGSTVYSWFGAHSAAYLNGSTAAEPAAVVRALQPVADAVGPAATAECGWDALASRTAGSFTSGYDARVAGTLLLIGEPGWRTRQPAAVGRVSAYYMPWPSAHPEHGSAATVGNVYHCMLRAAAVRGIVAPLPAPVFTVQGEVGINIAPTISAKLGISFDVGFPLASGVPYLALGVPNTDGCNASQVLGANSSAGAVAVTPLFPLMSAGGAFSWSALPSLRTTLYSGVAAARFGSQVMFAPPNATAGVPDVLIVAAPQYTQLFVPQQAQQRQRSLQTFNSLHEAGAVFVFGGTPAGFPLGPVANADTTAASWAALGSQQFGRLGSSMLVVDWFSDGVLKLVLGAPRATEALNNQTTAIEMPGAIYVYN